MIGNNHTDYEAVYRNTGLVSRTMRKVDDAYALHTFKSDARQAFTFFAEACIGLLVVGLPLLGIVALFAWVLGVVR